MPSKLSLASGLLAASTALATFTLDYPMARGYNQSTEMQFCGGFDTATTRTPFPLAGGPVQFTSQDPLSVAALLIATGSNASTYDNFQYLTPNGTLDPAFYAIDSGARCYNLKLTDSPLNLTNGTEITLQIQYNAGGGNLYQCADVVLVDGYTVPSNETCTTNHVSTTGNANLTGSGTLTLSSPTSLQMATATSATPTNGADKSIVGASVFGGALALIGAVAALL